MLCRATPSMRSDSEGPMMKTDAILTRRSCLRVAGGIGLSLASIARAAPPDPGGAASALRRNENGGYSFIPAMPFFSLGVRADPGFEIVRAVFRRPVGFPDGLFEVERHLRSEGRPLQALCGVELRQGQVQSLQDFFAFNADYIGRMKGLGLLVDGAVPMTRTNVAVGDSRGHEIYAFTYARRARPGSHAPTFVTSGIPDLRFVGTQGQEVAAGDTSPTGLATKTRFILAALRATIAKLGATWDGVTGVQAYTIHDIHPLIETVVIPEMGRSAVHGLHLYPTRPPAVGGEMEFDARSTAAEFSI